MTGRLLLKRLLQAVLVLAVAALAVPLLHLGLAVARDAAVQAALPAGHADDASHLNATPVRETWQVPAEHAAAERELVALLERARRERVPVAIAGARHSMGGHTIARDGLVVDMLPFRKMSLSADKKILTVQAGARWHDVIAFLDAQGRSVAVMQSNDSFSVGGSLSVNAHGWQVRRAPIATTVKSLRLLLADGRLLRCSRDENPELFALALGGYGLFGIILEAELETVPNGWYAAERQVVPAADFARVFREKIDGHAGIEMAYGRLRVTPSALLDEAVITFYRRVERPGVPLPALGGSPLDPLRRAVFRGSVDSDFGKELRWSLETAVGEKLGDGYTSRNQLLNVGVELYGERGAVRSDILHEYFLPPEKFADFLAVARELVPRHEADLLNVTLRDVREDHDTVLRYADRDMIAVVMLFSQPRTPEADADMAALTRGLVDASLALGGRYYLPYRGHATLAQFRRAYPQADAFAARKRQLDPGTIFRNRFYDTYLASPPAATLP